MKLTVFVSILTPQHGGECYPGGVRTAVHLSNREALEDLAEWCREMGGSDSTDEFDIENADDDEIEGYLEQCQDDDILDSWGLDECEIEISAEQIETACQTTT